MADRTDERGCLLLLMWLIGVPIALAAAADGHGDVVVAFGLGAGACWLLMRP